MECVKGDDGKERREITVYSKRFKQGFCGVVFACLLATAVWGDIIWNEPGGDRALGITGLTIGTRTFNVDFLYGSFESFWGDPTAPNPTLTCWNGSGLSTSDVIDAIQAEFPAGSPVPTYVGPYNETEYKLPYTYDGTYVCYDAAVSTNSWAFINKGPAGRDQTLVYAVCAEVDAVPVPGAVLLGVFGLSCSGWSLRRRMA